MAVLSGQIEAVEARLAERSAKPEVEPTLRNTMVASLAVGANSARDARLVGGAFGRGSGSESEDDPYAGAAGAGVGAGAGAPHEPTTGGRGLNGGTPAATMPTVAAQRMRNQRARLTQFSHSFHLGDTRNRTAVSLHSLSVTSSRLAGVPPPHAFGSARHLLTAPPALQIHSGPQDWIRRLCSRV